MFTGDPPFFDETQEKIFENIKKGYLELPKSMSPESQDFVKKLMIKDPLERQKFINKEGIRNHSWFKDIGRSWNIFNEKTGNEFMINQQT
jgi:serine/threonine protein kinase